MRGLQKAFFLAYETINNKYKGMFERATSFSRQANKVVIIS